MWGTLNRGCSSDKSEMMSDFCYQLRHFIKRATRFALIDNHVGCVLQGKLTGEDGESPQHDLLPLGQQPMTPVECGAHALLPPGARSMPIGQQAQGVCKPCGKAIDAKRANPFCGQFDCKRITVECAAEVGHRRSVGVAEGELANRGRGSLEEQLYRGKTKRLLGTRAMGSRTLQP